MAISTNQKPTIYRNLYENTGPGYLSLRNLSQIITSIAKGRGNDQNHYTVNATFGKEFICANYKLYFGPPRNFVGSKLLHLSIKKRWK